MDRANINNRHSGSASRRRWWFLLPIVLLVVLVSLMLVRRTDEDVRSVSSFIDGYFSSWSSQAMDKYELCFHPAATIHCVGPDGTPRSFALEPFITGQKEAHRRSRTPMKEVPLEKVIRVNGTLAYAEVEWRLSKGSETVTGVDIFCLTRTGDGWKILSLVFAEH